MYKRQTQTTRRQRASACSKTSASACKPKVLMKRVGLLRKASQSRSSVEHMAQQSLQACTKASVCSDLGPVTESDEEHRRRHHPMRKDCSRCVYIVLRSQLQASYGSYQHAVGSRVGKTVWLAPRPTRMQGVWGLGCLFCAARMQERPNLEGVPGKRRRYNNTKWARFEIRAVSQIAQRGIRQHAETQQHRMAVRDFFKPDHCSLSKL